MIPAPGEESVVQYQLWAADTNGVVSTDPPGSPLLWHRYWAVPTPSRRSLPRVDSLYDTVFPNGEAVVGVRVADNLAVAEVSLIWFRGRMQPGGLVVMEPNWEDPALYLGRLQWRLDGEETVHYLITATDSSRAANTGAFPPHDILGCS